jgi:hypothetical protein
MPYSILVASKGGQILSRSRLGLSAWAFDLIDDMGIDN